MQMSWYVWLFDVPGLMEELMPRDDWRFLKGWVGGQGDFERIREDLARPGALTAALNWYRANDSPMRLLDPPPTFASIECPVMGVFGARDLALTEDSMTGSDRFVSGPWRYERIEEAGHWIQLEQPARLNRLLIDFFQAAADADEVDARARLAVHDAGLTARLREAREDEPG